MKYPGYSPKTNARMKNYIALTLLCFGLMLFFESRAQLTNKGAQITIKNGATLYTSLGLQNSGGGIITNSGTIISDSFVTNNGGCTFSGNGTYQLQGNWKNAGTFTAGTSRTAGSRDPTCRSRPASGSTRTPSSRRTDSWSSGVRSLRASRP